jgi:hypothetical protein
MAENSGSGIMLVTREFGDEAHFCRARCNGDDTQRASRLSSSSQCSPYILTRVETFGDALAAGWGVHARSLEGVVDNTRPSSGRA